MSWIVAWICRATSSLCCSSSFPNLRTVPYVDFAPPYAEREDDEFLNSLDISLRNRFEMQRKSDMETKSDYYPIVFDDKTNDGRQMFPFGFGDLDELISQSFRSVIFLIPQYLAEPRIIKYSHNCGREDQLHPLLMDAWIGAIASRSGYVSLRYYVSAPRKMTREDFANFGFKISKRETEKCVGSSLRYLVMEYIDGESLVYHQRSYRLEEALKIGLNLMQALRELHAVGIAHGDLREEHVLVDRQSKLIRIIDFSAARPVGAENTDKTIFMSPWELRGDVYSFRDDVFRALRILALMLNGMSEYASYETSLMKEVGVAGLLQWKLDKNFFFVPGRIDPIERAIGYNDRPRVRAITRLLQFLVSVVQRMDDDPSDIPYDEMIAGLAQLERRLSDDEPTRVRFASEVQPTTF